MHASKRLRRKDIFHRKASSNRNIFGAMTSHRLGTNGKEVPSLISGIETKLDKKSILRSYRIADEPESSFVSPYARTAAKPSIYNRTRK